MLPGLSAKLRTSGKIGSYFADLLGIMSWLGVTVTLIGTALITLSSAALNWIDRPAVYIPAAVFLFFLWTFIGVAILRAKQKPQTVRIAHEYAYSIIPDSATLSLGQFAPNAPANAGEDAISIIYNFRNVSAGPLRLVVEEFRVVLDGRTSADPETPKLELMFARLAPKSLRSGGIPRNKEKKHLLGTVSIKFYYGPPDGEFLRVYALKTELQVGFDESGLIGALQDRTVLETDMPYVSR